MPNQIFTHHSDPEHGWLEVKRADLKELGLEAKISRHSYERGDTIYLEEDGDATRFILAYSQFHGEPPKTISNPSNHPSFIRRLNSYQIPKDIYEYTDTEILDLLEKYWEASHRWLESGMFVRSNGRLHIGEDRKPESLPTASHTTAVPFVREAIAMSKMSNVAIRTDVRDCILRKDNTLESIDALIQLAIFGKIKYQYS